MHIREHSLGWAGKGCQAPGLPAQLMVQPLPRPGCVSVLAFKCTLCQNARRSWGGRTTATPRPCAPLVLSPPKLLTKPHACCSWSSSSHLSRGLCWDPLYLLSLCFLPGALGSCPLPGGVPASCCPPGLPAPSASGSSTAAQSPSLLSSHPSHLPPLHRSSRSTRAPGPELARFRGTLRAGHRAGYVPTLL